VSEKRVNKCPIVNTAAATMSSSKGRKRGDDGVFDDDSDDSKEEEDVSKPAAKKRKKQSFIDDAAEESGDEDGDDDEDEDDDEGNNEYVKDDFVVDEEDDDAAHKKKDDLEDSDDDVSDDEEHDSARLKKVRKMRTTDLLDDDDLALIKEARGDVDDDDNISDMEEVAEKPRERVVAKTEAELRKGLFTDSDEEDQFKSNNEKKKQSKPKRVDLYDEDGMDDFIEDDIGDQENIRMADRKSYDEDAREVNEAQLNEASEIFGTDYLEFMHDEDADEDEEELMGKSKFRERGVGVSYGVDSEDEVLSDEEEDDDDLFGDENDDGMDGSSAQQKAEALRLKRERRNLAKAERRRQGQLKKSERRKAQLRRAFEPVQLVENFCTDRDDDIRQSDIPERFYDWKVPFHGSAQVGTMNDDEEAEARWIASRIPEIASEMASAEDSEVQQTLILTSIANALQYMHRDKLEPAFIKRYRKDYVVSTAVQNNLDNIMDEDGEWHRVTEARTKVEAMLEAITNSANADESVGADAQKLIALQEELADAQKKLDETAKQESQVNAELTALGGADDDDDDDDELFGDDDDDDEVRFIFLLL
jgi:transcription elongation factor SPT6